jgi:hypothetical protein
MTNGSLTNPHDSDVNDRHSSAFSQLYHDTLIIISVGETVFHVIIHLILQISGKLLAFLIAFLSRFSDQEDQRLFED